MVSTKGLCHLFSIVYNIVDHIHTLYDRMIIIANFLIQKQRGDDRNEQSVKFFESSGIYQWLS